jgi:hypothetical protein
MNPRRSPFTLAVLLSWVVLLLSCTVSAQHTVYITVTYHPDTQYCTQASNPPSGSPYLVDVPNGYYVSWVSAAANDPIDVKFAPGKSPFYETNSQNGSHSPSGPVGSGQANGLANTNRYYQSLMVGGHACNNVNGVGGAQQLGFVMR